MSELTRTQAPSTTPRLQVPAEAERTRTRAIGEARGNRVGRTGRRWLLLAHLLAVGGWFGVDVMIGVLVFTSAARDDPAVVAVCFQALSYAMWPMVIGSLATLVTGLALSWGTVYGFVRYWWVVVKLVINVVLTALVLVALRPGLEEVAQRGAQIAAGQGGDLSVGDLVFPPVVSLTALTVATVLSVFKPWGRTRRTPERGRSSRVIRAG